MAKGGKSHHHLRGNRRDPYAHHVAAFADHAGRRGHGCDRGGRGGGVDPAHLHARDPEDGSPTPSPDVFMEFLPRIKQATDAVVNITTGGGHGMTLKNAARRRWRSARK